MTNNNERVYSWDDTIEKESEFILIPDGDYEFLITDLERSQYEPGPNAKLPTCPMAIVHCEINADEGKITLKERLYLHSRMEGMLSAFFGSIGQKEKDQPLRMDWSKVVGSRGWCTVAQKTIQGREGDMITINEIKRFIRKDNEPVEQKTWTAGSF